MNKKGVTLVELIAILALIALIATIFFPNINRILNKSKNTSGTVQDSTIVESAKSYLMDHIEDDISFDDTSQVDIKLKVLVDEGYLSREPKQPKTGKSYDLNNSSVTITKVNESYNYTLNLNTR